MKKNTIKLTEAQLQKLIKESVNSLLKEGHYDSSVYEQFEEIRQKIGDDTLINELYQWMNSDQIEEFISDVRRNYDLDDPYADDEDFEEDEW